jgi:hypothetical protein
MSDARIDIFVVPSGQTGIEQIVTEEIIATLTTDVAGEFTTETSIDSRGVYEVSAVFRDTGDNYLESSDARNVTVGGPPPILGDWKNLGWFSVILGVPLAILIPIGAFLYYRHYRKTHPREAKEPETLVAPQPPPPPPIAAHPASESPVKIALPQIAQPFPDVWGRGDDLIIVFTVDGSRYTLAQASLDIELGPDSTTRAPVGQQGRVSQEHTYRSAGQYEIKAVLVKEVRNGYVPASRMVRIVDYREEIVRLNNEMVATLQTRGMALTAKMTAREVETRLTRAMPALHRETAGGLISVFEEANYSLHPMARSAYERMYLACLEVKEHAGE